MSQSNAVIDFSQIIRYHLEAEFDQIYWARPENIMDLATIHHPEDMKHLASWEAYLKSLKIPFAITKEKNVHKLWKERRV